MKNLLFTLTVFILFTSVTFSQPDTLTILHVNDTHSTLAPLGPRNEFLNGKQGGIARVTNLIGMTRMVDPNVLLLHAGDFSIGDVFYNAFFGVPELQWMKQMGFDAMTVGNHEFDLGPTTLLGTLLNAFPAPTDGFPLLCANGDFSDPSISALQNYIFSYTTKAYGDLKVGIFGLTTPETNLLSMPAPVFIDTLFVQKAGEMVQTLKLVENCDVVIMLSHLGVYYDQIVVSYVPEINLIIGGHDHYKYETPLTLTDPMGGTTWLVQARSNYMYAGKLQLLVDGTDVQLLNYNLIPIDENIPEEPTVKGLVDGLIAMIESPPPSGFGIPFYTQALGYSNALIEEEAKDLLNLGTHDTPAGNLVTDAFKWYTSTDLAIEAGGSIALPLNEGVFVPADIFRMIGYGFNTDNYLGFRVVTFELTGMELLTGLEFGLSQIELNDEFLIQVSGMEYTFDGTKPPYQRLVTVKINDQPIDLTATYTITANEMVLGILDFLTITPSNVNILTGVTEFQVIYEYIMSQGNVVHPKTLGRILNVGNQETGAMMIAAGWMNQSASTASESPLNHNRLFFETNVRDWGLNYQPWGRIQIRYPAENITLRSAECEWLLIENSLATVKGVGKINGQGNYGFLLLAMDDKGGLLDCQDKLRVVVWDKSDGDRIVYDNLEPQNIRGVIILRELLAKEGLEMVDVPVTFSLEQNYPNPFNPTTTINYSIPEAGNVELKVYDVLGNEIASLVNQEMAPGNYTANFDATSLASGVYIYSLRTNNLVQIKKMILIR